MRIALFSVTVPGSAPAHLPDGDSGFEIWLDGTVPQPTRRGDAADLPMPGDHANPGEAMETVRAPTQDDRPAHIDETDLLAPMPTAPQALAPPSTGSESPARPDNDNEAPIMSGRPRSAEFPSNDIDHAPWPVPHPGGDVLTGLPAHVPIVSPFTGGDAPASPAEHDSRELAQPVPYRERSDRPPGPDRPLPVLATPPHPELVEKSNPWVASSLQAALPAMGAAAMTPDIQITISDETPRPDVPQAGLRLHDTPQPSASGRLDPAPDSVAFRAEPGRADVGKDRDPGNVEQGGRNPGQEYPARGNDMLPRFMHSAKVDHARPLIADRWPINSVALSGGDQKVMAPADLPPSAISTLPQEEPPAGTVPLRTMPTPVAEQPDEARTRMQTAATDRNEASPILRPSTRDTVPADLPDHRGNVPTRQLQTTGENGDPQRPATTFMRPLDVIEPSTVTAFDRLPALAPPISDRAISVPNAAASTPAPPSPALQLSQAIIRSTPGSGQTELTLSPEELGKVQFGIRNIDGQLTIAITAERPETLTLLRRHAELLASDLAQSGMGDAALDFGGAGQGRDRHAQDLREAASRRRPTGGDMAESPAVMRPPDRLAGVVHGSRLNIRL